MSAEILWNLVDSCLIRRVFLIDSSDYNLHPALRVCPAETRLTVYRRRLVWAHSVVTVSRTISGKFQNDEKYFARKWWNLAEKYFPPGDCTIVLWHSLGLSGTSLIRFLKWIVTSQWFQDPFGAIPGRSKWWKIFRAGIVKIGRKIFFTKRL